MAKWTTFVAGTLLAIPCIADTVEFASLTEDCEEALALSALPVELRGRASVWVWRDGDFVRSRVSDGGFDCIVQRNHPDSIIPECITSTGRDSILEGIKLRTRLVAEGMDGDAADQKVLDMIEAGEVPAPSGPGVNYMMSAYNRIYTSRADAVGQFPPHTMFFAPGARKDVVGGDYRMARETKGFPFVVEAGSHSYIVTITDRAADSGDVRAACKNQIELDSLFGQDAAATQR